MGDPLQRQSPDTSSALTLTTIAFERYSLGNGLDVILHEDHKSPLVHVLVWYHVGSKNESMDRTGFAHFFEHMMFQGSENVGKTEHFTHVQGVGGSLNASTGQDRTNYFQTVSSEHLRLALWLESDRMRSLKVTEENFQNQLAVVKEERSQRYDNAPYGLWYMTLLELVFGGSIYGWSPIGDMAHLDAATLESVQEFHRTFYRPNNATLVVAGDFDPKEVRGAIEEYFGTIDPGPAVTRPTLVLPPMLEQERRTITANVPLPSVYVGFRSVAVGEPDARALSLLALILYHGRSSRLQHSLVYQMQIAQSVAAFHVEMEGTGLFVLMGTASDGVSAAKVEEELWNQLARICADGPEQRELDGALNFVRTSAVRALCRLQGVADSLAHSHVLRGDASLVNMMLKEYESITLADLKSVACRYLQPEKAGVLHYLPEN